MRLFSVVCVGSLVVFIAGVVSYEGRGKAHETVSQEGRASRASLEFSPEVGPEKQRVTPRRSRDRTTSANRGDLRCISVSHEAIASGIFNRGDLSHDLLTRWQVSLKWEVPPKNHDFQPCPKIQCQCEVLERDTTSREWHPVTPWGAESFGIGDTPNAHYQVSCRTFCPQSKLQYLIDSGAMPPEGAGFRTVAVRVSIDIEPLLDLPLTPSTSPELVPHARPEILDRMVNDYLQAGARRTHGTADFTSLKDAIKLWSFDRSFANAMIRVEYEVGIDGTVELAESFMEDLAIYMPENSSKIADMTVEKPRVQILME